MTPVLLHGSCPAEAHLTLNARSGDKYQPVSAPPIIPQNPFEVNGKMKPAKHSPVKDRRTVPWVSEDEIPAVKLLLRAWRRLRREAPAIARVDAKCAAAAKDPGAILAERLRDLAMGISIVAALEARLAKENTAE